MCPRDCGANRTESYGVCGAKGLRIARYGKHYWEEPIISGVNGSGTVFFSGCALKCVYCQNYEVSHFGKGKDITIEELTDIFRRLEGEGAHNINLVTPSHFALDIIEALDKYRPQIPIIYNCGGYEKEETLNILKDYIDIYLTDIKYMDIKIADEYSGAANYPSVAIKAAEIMRRNQPKDIITDGIMEKGLIIRHLALPGHIEDSKAVIDIALKKFGKSVIFSLMNQYTPYGAAKLIPELNRKLKPIEYKILCNYALNRGMVNVFAQEEGSNSEEYIPEFDGDYIK